MGDGEGSLSEFDFCSGYVDSHLASDGTVCLASGSYLDARYTGPVCCEQSVTVDGGRNPLEVLPVQMDEAEPWRRMDVVGADRCLWDRDLSLQAVVTDRWGQRAGLLAHDRQAPGKELLLGPSYSAAQGLGRALTGPMPTRQAEDVTAWLISRWRQIVTSQARRAELQAREAEVWRRSRKREIRQRAQERQRMGL